MIEPIPYYPRSFVRPARLLDVPSEPASIGRDLTGRVFGRLTVVRWAGTQERNGNRFAMWECLCSCGNTKIVRAGNLLANGHTRSCGCAKRVAFGTPEERFWKKVNKTEGCWLWTGGHNGVGYGIIRVWAVRSYAHRFSWVLHNGPVPEGLQVLHRCDVPACVRPDHLFLGTQQANVDDMRNKGRARGSPRGESNPKAKLNNQAVLYIRSSKEPPIVLAAKFGVTNSYICAVQKRRKWRHI